MAAASARRRSAIGREGTDVDRGRLGALPGRGPGGGGRGDPVDRRRGPGLRRARARGRGLTPMRALLQRVSRAEVRVDDEVVGACGRGLLILVGVGRADDADTAQALARRVVELRIFDDEEGKTNRSLLDVGGEALVVSQFTLYADTSRGPAPGLRGGRAARPRETALPPVRLEHRVAPASASPRAASPRRWRSSWSTTARSRSGSTPTTADEGASMRDVDPLLAGEGDAWSTVERNASDERSRRSPMASNSDRGLVTAGHRRPGLGAPRPCRGCGRAGRPPMHRRRGLSRTECRPGRS